MKKIPFILFLLLVGFSASPCNNSWNYCSTAESADPFIDDSMGNCCGGTSVTVIDLCGNKDKFIIVTMDGPNSSCFG